MNESGEIIIELSKRTIGSFSVFGSLRMPEMRPPVRKDPDSRRKNLSTHEVLPYNNALLGATGAE
jgi:hypothetical protein